MFTKKMYADYLNDNGFSQYTASGNPSTVYDYIHRINGVLKREGLTWADLPTNIDTLVQEYGKGGKKEKLGATSHNAVISALKQIQNMVRRDEYKLWFIKFFICVEKMMRQAK